LFDDLTVYEHFLIFSIFKNNSKETEIWSLIWQLDLEAKSEDLAKSLSGGQKWKLSVGIALIGGSKFVLLDEPTSGMDPTAWRKLWDVLKF